jgi:hypothetical protein
MDMNRITHPLRLAKGSHRGALRVGIAGMAVLAGMALGADPVANATPAGFFGAVQAAGVTGVGPAMLEDGRNVCWQIWNGGYTGQQAAAALQKTNPALTTDQADKFVLAAYQNLCPVPGSYDWWAYSTG